MAYASRSLTEVERRYSQTEREALAVVWGCERFHIYLIVTQFTISTDHKALEVIYSPKSKPPAHIERWALRLQLYDYCIQHRKGEGNPTDVLSRKSLPDTASTPYGSIADQYVNFLVKHLVPNHLSMMKVTEKILEDQGYNWCVRTCYLGRAKPITVTENQLLMRGTQLVIPQQLQTKTLHLAHLVEIMTSTTAPAVMKRLDRIFATHGLPKKNFLR